VQTLTTMKILQNSSRHLQSELIQQCFIKNQTTHVDKLICGNGFTTSFVELTPADDKINIIIAPNVGVLEEKEKKYNNHPRIKFFYGRNSQNCKQNPTNFDNADVLFFVADSFLLREEKLKAISHKIDKVLIDEFHSIEQQSEYRDKLVRFIHNVERICDDKYTSIVTVTATPNYFSKIDITILSDTVEQTDMFTCFDAESTLKRIKIDLKNDENVVVFTNDSNKAYKLRNERKNELKARFKCGSTFMATLCEKTKIIDEKCNLTIITSRGFEGWDIDTENTKVYFFEDRSKQHETFYISNLYQAINRTRNKPKYIEYSRQNLNKTRKNPFKVIDVEIDNFIERTDLSIEKKQAGTVFKKPNIYKDYVIFNELDNGEFEIFRNETAINLYKERLLYDNGIRSVEFQKFLELRNINLIHMDSVCNRITVKIKRDSKVKNLKANTVFIEKNNLFGSDYTFKPIKYNGKLNPTENDIRLFYLKHFERFLRRKNYNNSYVLTDRQKIALELFSDKNKYHKLIRSVVKTYNDRKDKNESEKVRREKIKIFRENAIHITSSLISYFSNDIIKFPKKIIAHRDYNITVETSIRCIYKIADVFDIDVTEIDVTTCFPRLIYALCGLELPDDFYGKNKRNKRAINILLNSFKYDSSKKTLKKVQRNNAIINFRKYNFDERVIKYLIDNFFDAKYRGDLFNHISHKERLLIDKLNDIDFLCDGKVRRHDSLLIFNNKTELDLRDFEFLNVNNWLHISSNNGIKNLQEMKSCKNLIPEKSMIATSERECVYIYNNNTHTSKIKLFDESIHKRGLCYMLNTEKRHKEFDKKHKYFDDYFKRSEEFEPFIQELLHEERLNNMSGVELMKFKMRELRLSS